MQLHRIPFFLEPEYNRKAESFRESHTGVLFFSCSILNIATVNIYLFLIYHTPHPERMLKKFGSQEAFDRVRAQQQLVPRLAAAGLDTTSPGGYTQENLDQRVQSATLNSHRLVIFVAQVLSSLCSHFRPHSLSHTCSISTHPSIYLSTYLSISI